MPKPPFLSGLHLNVPPVCFCVLIHWIVTFDWEEVPWTSVFHSGENISLCLYVRDVLQYVYGTGMTTFAMSSSYSLPVTLALFSIGSIHWVNPYPGTGIPFTAAGLIYKLSGCYFGIVFV